MVFVQTEVGKFEFECQRQIRLASRLETDALEIALIFVRL